RGETRPVYLSTRSRVAATPASLRPCRKMLPTWCWRTARALTGSGSLTETPTTRSWPTFCASDQPASSSSGAELVEGVALGEGDAGGGGTDGAVVVGDAERDVAAGAGLGSPTGPPQAASSSPAVATPTVRPTARRVSVLVPRPGARASRARPSSAPRSVRRARPCRRCAARR